MRLLQKGANIVPLFTLSWEVSYLAHLAEQGVEWMSIARVGDARPLGIIHTQTHEIRLHEGVTIVNRQVAVLGPIGPTRLQ
jgi:hypothetical protein